MMADETTQKENPLEELRKEAEAIQRKITELENAKPKERKETLADLFDQLESLKKTIAEINTPQFEKILLELEKLQGKTDTILDWVDDLGQAANASIQKPPTQQPQQPKRPGKTQGLKDAFGILDASEGTPEPESAHSDPERFGETHFGFPAKSKNNRLSPLNIVIVIVLCLITLAALFGLKII